VNVKGLCTNTVPVCAYRGAGRPEAAYLLERLVDAAARELGMSPDAIHRVNFVPPSAMPYTSAAKLVLDSGEFEKVMDTCMAAAEWSSFAKRRAQSERNGKLRGIGMATYTERCGGGFPIAVARSGGQRRRFFSAAGGLSLTAVSTAGSRDDRVLLD
jgi:carbon-monoxide dehydrogenase large subunit